MGNIIQFAGRVSRQRRTQAEDGVRPACQIIILPCVRYERWSDDSAKPAAQKAKKKAKRRARGR